MSPTGESFRAAADYEVVNDERHQGQLQERLQARPRVQRRSGRATPSTDIHLLSQKHTIDARIKFMVFKF